ncbi:unnamed protein product, partial [Amoebophrya sp. A25]|eukprot:GSA25T00007340001.1
MELPGPGMKRPDPRRNAPKKKHKPAEQALSLTWENVSVKAGGKTILQDVSGHVKAGETLVLLGSAGAGKTTLLSLLAGVFQPPGGGSRSSAALTAASEAREQVSRKSRSTLDDANQDQLQSNKKEVGASRARRRKKEVRTIARGQNEQDDDLPSVDADIKEDEIVSDLDDADEPLLDPDEEDGDVLNEKSFFARRGVDHLTDIKDDINRGAKDDTPAPPVSGTITVGGSIGRA